MGVEIERKFLVDRDHWNALDKPAGKSYRQGYLLTEPGKTIRVRIAQDEAFLTIKGGGNGLSRPEYEYAIPVAEAEELLAHFTPTHIAKIRYRIPFAGKVWEVDEFHGDNEGLLLAEVELTSEDEAFELPAWVSREVTDDKRYYNSFLSLFPYSNWK